MAKTEKPLTNNERTMWDNHAARVARRRAEMAREWEARADREAAATQQRAMYRAHGGKIDGYR